MSGSRSRRSPSGEGRDRGSGLVEILVAVALLGLGATGTLTAIAAAIRGSVQHDELSDDRRWLVSAADHLVSSNVPRVACTSGETAVRDAYQAAVQSVTSGRPDGWAASQITVSGTVTFWNGSSFGSTCYESNGLKIQLISLQVADPDGVNKETLTVVKRDG